MGKTIAAIIIAGGLAAASFWGGTYYQSRPFIANRSFSDGVNGRQTGPGLRTGPGGGPGGQGRLVGPGGSQGEPLIEGRLDKADDGELTLTTQFGSVKIKLEAGAIIKRTDKAKPADLKPGEQVIIKAKMNSGGDLSAKSIIID